ncbi:MAG: acyl-CoA dehydrogenase, partial [Mycobacterium sp.]
MMDAVFAEYRRSHSPSTSTGRDTGLWRGLDQLGLARLTGAEQSGGSGAGWYEAAALLAAAVRHGIRIPLAENDLLACWLLEAAGVTVDGKVRTVCLLDDDGRATWVPWASCAERLVVVWQEGGEHLAADTELGHVVITSGANMIGEPRDTVVADVGSLIGVPVTADLVGQLRLKSA